jgi:hypothetical protein
MAATGRLEGDVYCRSPLAGDAFGAGIQPFDQLEAVNSEWGIRQSKSIARERAPT